MTLSFVSRFGVIDEISVDLMTGGSVTRCGLTGAGRMRKGCKAKAF
jgi:hypothetical protein